LNANRNFATFFKFILFLQILHDNQYFGYDYLNIDYLNICHNIQWKDGCLQDAFWTLLTSFLPV